MQIDSYENWLTATLVKKKTEIELARRDTMRFIHYTKPDFEEGRHHPLLANAVDKLIYGKNIRLIISLPPRHSKSEFFSIRLPLIYLGHHPKREFVLVSHTLNLAEYFSRQVRDIVRDGSLYHRLFPNTILSPDRQRINDWALIAGGGFRALGVGAGLSGRGADLLDLDDIIKEGDEMSPKILDDKFIWYVSAARTRLMPGGNIAIPMTRWSTRDIAGRLQALADAQPQAEQWEVIELPALATSEDDPLGREIGEALWPEWYDEKTLRAIEITSEKYFQALYQQTPLDETGKLFEAKDFKRYEPDVWIQAVWTFDLAISEDNAGDFTAIGRWRYDEETGCLYVQQLERLQKTWPKVKNRIKEIIPAHPNDIFAFPKHLIELATVQDLKHDLPDYTNQIIGVEQKGDKAERAGYHAARSESGRVFVEAGELGDSFIREHDEFPTTHDDWVDMASVAAHHFGLREEIRLIMGQDPDEKRRQELLAREKQWIELKERIGGV